MHVLQYISLLSSVLVGEGGGSTVSVLFWILSILINLPTNVQVQKKRKRKQLHLLKRKVSLNEFVVL